MTGTGDTSATKADAAERVGRIVPDDPSMKDKVECPFCACLSTYLACHFVEVPNNAGFQFECPKCASRGPVRGDRRSAFTAFKYGNLYRFL